MGCHSFLQGIFPIQGSNLGLLHCRQILNHLSHQGRPCIHISTLFGFPFQLGHHRAMKQFHVLCSKFSIVNYFIHKSVYNPSLPIHPISPSPLVSMCLFSVYEFFFKGSVSYYPVLQMRKSIEGQSGSVKHPSGILGNGGLGIQTLVSELASLALFSHPVFAYGIPQGQSKKYQPAGCHLPTHFCFVLFFSLLV